MASTTDTSGQPEGPDNHPNIGNSIHEVPATGIELPVGNENENALFDQDTADESHWWPAGKNEFEEVEGLDSRMNKLGISREARNAVHTKISYLLDQNDNSWEDIKQTVASYLDEIVVPQWGKGKPFDFEKPVDASEEHASLARQAVKESPKQPKMRQSTKVAAAALASFKLLGTVVSPNDAVINEADQGQSAAVTVENNVVHGNAGEWSESLPNFEETQALVDGVLETFRSVPDGSNPDEPQLAGEDIILVDDRVYTGYLLRSRPIERSEAENYIKNMDPEVLTIDEYDVANPDHVALVTVAKVNRAFRDFVGNTNTPIEHFSDPLKRGGVLRQFGEYLDLTGEQPSQGFAEIIEGFSEPTNEGFDNARNPNPVFGLSPDTTHLENISAQSESSPQNVISELPSRIELPGMLEAISDNPSELAEMILSNENIDYKAAVEGNNPMRTRDALRYISQNGVAYHGLELERTGEFADIPVNVQMLKVLTILANNGVELTLTAVNDGEHAETSHHYTDEAAAFDIAIVPSDRETMTDDDIAHGIAIRDWLFQNRDILGLEELLFTPNGDVTNNILNGQIVEPDQEISAHNAHIHAAFNSARVSELISPTTRLVDPITDPATEARIAELLSSTDGFTFLNDSDLLTEEERLAAYFEGAQDNEDQLAAEPAPAQTEVNIDGITNPNAEMDDALWEQIKNIYREHSVEIEALATEVGIDPAVAGGILSVESGGEGFWEDGSLKIRFEPHEFIRVAGDNGVIVSDEARAWLDDFVYRRDDLDQTGPSDEYIALQYASGINEEIAHQTISMGGPQIMGYHFGDLGYGSAIEMFQSFSGENGEAQQLIALGRFMLADQRLVDAANVSDWDTFASIYNGPDYRENDYQNKLPNATEAYGYIYQMVFNQEQQQNRFNQS